MSEPQPFEAERFRQDLQVDARDLSTCFVEQASLYAYYAERHHQATRRLQDADLLVEIVEAKFDKAARATAATDGSKITEVQIGRLMTLDPDVIKARRRAAEAKANVALAQSALEAFKQRRDMLVQLGAAQREELKGDLAMRAKEALHDTVRQRLSEKMS